MKRACTIALMTTSFFSTSAQAAQESEADRVYFGRVGKADAVLCIGSDTKAGRYFYRKNGIDIPLQILDKGRNSFLFKETSDEGKEDVVTWTVKTSDRRISGVLFNPHNGKRVPVEFTLKQSLRDNNDSGSPDSCASSLNFAEGQDNSYVQAKVARPVKVVTAVEKEGIKVQQVLEPVSETEWIRIAEHPDRKIKEKINSLLHFQLQSKILRSLDCRSSTNLMEKPVGSIEQQIAIRFFTRNILSVEERIFGDCGGSHPFGGLIGMTFDLQSGGQIQPNRIFKRAYFDEQSGHQGFTDNFRNVLVQYFSRSNKEEDRQMPNCLRDGLYFNAWLDADGAWFSEGNYRLHECGEPFFVPYSILRETLKDEVARLLGLISRK